MVVVVQKHPKADLEHPIAVNLRISKDMADQIDRWRRAQLEIPSLARAVRYFLKKGLREQN